MINFFMISQIIAIGIVIFLQFNLVFYNMFRRFKGLPPTFPALHSQESKLIRSHGKWIYVGKLQMLDRTFNDTEVYKCEDCDMRLCKYVRYATLGDYNDANHYKNRLKTCNEIIMENILE